MVYTVILVVLCVHEGWGARAREGWETGGRARGRRTLPSCSRTHIKYGVTASSAATPSGSSFSDASLLALGSCGELGPSDPGCARTTAPFFPFLFDELELMTDLNVVPLVSRSLSLSGLSSFKILRIDANPRKKHLNNPD